MNKNILLALFLFLNFNLCLNLTSCNTAEPPIPPIEKIPALSLELDDVTCTEAWLQLTTKDLVLPAELTLKQYNPTGDSLSQSFLLNTQDSLLYIDSLLPNQTYNFQLSCIWNPASGNQQQVSSIKQQVTTMDTTSHNFTFQSWTFGTIGSSTLYDVAIINGNDIWAVGEILIADTSQNGYTTYNAVHWDGSEWTLHKLYFYTIPGQPDTGVYEAKSILAFDENNIWITSGSQITKWNGIRQTNRHSSPVYVNKLWGTDNNNIYAVGYNGQIAHYNGTNWQRIESGTTLEFMDIYGANNSKTGKQEIIAVSTQNLPLDKAIFKIDGNTATQISSTPIQWELFSCWFIPNRHYYVVGSGIYEKINLAGSNWKNEPLDITHYGTSRIRGSALNDVFVVGAFGEILHYNGFSWKSFLPELGTFNGSYGSLDIKENLVAITGLESAKAKITIGHR